MLQDILMLQLSSDGRIMFCSRSNGKTLQCDCHDKGYFWDSLYEQEERKRVKAIFRAEELRLPESVQKSKWKAHNGCVEEVFWWCTRFPQDTAVYVIIFKEQEEARSAKECCEVPVEAGDYVIHFLPCGTITFVNEVYCRFLKQSAEELLGTSVYSSIPPDVQDEVREKLCGFTQEEPNLRMDHFIQDEDGVRRFVKWFDGGVFDAQGVLVEIHRRGRDETKRLELEQSLQERDVQYKELFETSLDGIAITDLAGYYVNCNPSYLRLTGFELGELAQYGQFQSLTAPEYRELEDSHLECLRKTGSCEYEKELITGRGGRVALSVKGWLGKDVSGEPVSMYFIHRDISSEKRSAEHIRFLNYHDKLTGVYNRAFLEAALEDLSAGRVFPLTVIVADINGLKLVNDAFGHQEGDRLIRLMTKVISRTCGEKALVARWGGDECAAVLPQVTYEEGWELLKKIRETFSSEDVGRIPMTVSLGLSTQEEGAPDFYAVVRDAEEMMHRNKLLESSSVRNSIISSLERTLFEKSFETEEHTWRIQRVCLEVGQKLDITADKLDELVLLAALHDIGKLGVSDEILGKPGRLTSEEWEDVKRHPEIGYRIALSSPNIAYVAEGVLSHHEWYDGTGYPRGLKGEEIPLTARIISILDAYDVMRHGRAYQRKKTKEEALEELQRCAGTQFDPQLVAVLVGILDSIDE